MAERLLFPSLRMRSAGSIGFGLTLLSWLLAFPAAALPPGRSWAPTVRWEYPGVISTSGTRIETDAVGNPFLIVHARWNVAQFGTWNLFAWRDSGWVHTFDSGGVGGLDVPEMALSLTARQRMTWVTGTDDRDGARRMAIAELRPDSILPPDTAMVTTSQDTEWDGAVSARRRWVIRSHTKPPFNRDQNPFKVSTAYSDTPGVWHELPDLGIDEYHCAAAPLGDTTAMVVYTGKTGLAYCIAEGNRWVRHGILDSRPYVPLHPRLRFRPSGGLWLLWTDRPWVHVSRYRDGQWDRGDSLRAIHPRGETYWSAWCDLTLDGAERPVLAWGDLGVGYTYRDVGVVAFPTDSGWTPGEEIPGSDNLFLTPLVARDRNGDVWANWRVRDFLTNRWTHTYVHATCSTPAIIGAGRNRVVTWTLSEPAPESWWAVLRARNDGLFEVVARVQAGVTPEMSWTDTAPPAGVLRYRIRRESVDTRYQWESEEARWPSTSSRPLRLARTDAAGLSGELELTGAAAGSLEVRLYDVQGRLVLKQHTVAGGSGRDAIRLDFGSVSPPLGAGIYFAAVRDATGNLAPPVRIVLLK